MGLFKKMKKYKDQRKNYIIEPSVRCYIDKEDYYFAFLPTITWMPWICRPFNSDGIIDIWWFNFHICIGYWERLR